MKIIKAGTHGHYDVFSGTGWKNHTRVRWLKKEGRLQHATGKFLSSGATQAVITHITEEKK